MEEETKNNDKSFWRLNIAFIAIILVVLAGSIIIILLQGSHLISGKEIARDTTFPWIVFIPIWLAVIRKQRKPAPSQEKIIRIMMITGIILLIANVLVFLIL